MMNNAFDQLQGMIKVVAEALGDDLLREVAFVGGCTTGLLITDVLTKEGIRFTDDIDLIVNVMGYSGWAELQNKLINKGFSINPEDEVICRMRLGALKVDFMPDDTNILGFTNRWYKAALDSAQDYALTDGLTIRLLTSPYFVATKFEAYKGRGNSDLLSSHDMEDIFNIIDGRVELIDELKAAEKDVCNYVANEVSGMLSHAMIEYAVQNLAKGDSGREQIIFSRLESIAQLNKR